MENDEYILEILAQLSAFTQCTNSVLGNKANMKDIRHQHMLIYKNQNFFSQEMLDQVHEHLPHHSSA